jgi:hypothetical protein
MDFDPFKQSKLMNGFDKLKSVQPYAQLTDNLDDLKRLAGVHEKTSYGEEMSIQGSNLGQIQRENNIRPGTDEWFRLWFAKPHLTGEKPYDK